MTAVTKSYSRLSRRLPTGLELHLQCPQCSAPLGTLRQDEFPPEFLYSCTACRFQLLNENGIWKALPLARREYFDRFLREYKTVREAEGRGSRCPEYYLALPFQDLSRENQKQWEIRSRTYKYLEHKILPRIEANAGRELKVLDLGSGNGWLSYRLSLRGYSPVAVDIFTSELDGLGAAAHYRKKLPELFPRFQAEVDRLPFRDGQFDLAIFNASFHYSENSCETLGEAIRCLRTSGTVVIADTAWYTAKNSGERMLAERRRMFTEQYGFPSDALASLEYLTDERLSALEQQFGIRWRMHTPFYGIGWALRPITARLAGKREPSRFRIYVAEVAK